MKFVISLLLMFSFSESFGQDFDKLVDTRDGQEYKIVKIGNQWWTAENINYNILDESWYYENDSINYHNFGRFYTFESAKESCPCDWHLPTDKEWKDMEIQIGLSKNDVEAYNLRGSTEGGKLKAIGFEYWNSPNQNATNSTGFSALGSGYRNSDGDFGRIGKGTSFWTSTDGNQDMAWFRSLHSDRGDIHRGYYKKSFAYNVRCIKNNNDGFDYEKQDKYSELTYSDLLLAYKSELNQKVKSPGDTFVLPSYNNKKISLVTYQSDGLELNALLYKPDTEPGTKLPVLIYFHGGYSLDTMAFLICKPFMDKGFAVLFPTSRGENGNDGNFELFYGEVNDAKNAIKWLANQDYIDQNRIYTFGHSIGGGISSLLSLHDDIPVKYTASCGGLYKDQSLIRMSERPGIPFNPQIKEERRLRLLIGNIKYMKRKHFAFHGDSDMLENVKIAYNEMSDIDNCKLEIFEVKGGHVESAFPAIDKYLEIILNDKK